MGYHKDVREWKRIMKNRNNPRTTFLGYKLESYYENENDYGKIPKYNFYCLSEDEKKIYNEI